MSEAKLQDLTRTMLVEYTFPGTDAAVVFIADGAATPREVAEVLSRSGQHRWFPVSGGNQIKVPFHFAKGREALFEREKKGWNHEHCDFCDSSIGIGELCWTAPSKRGIFIVCKQCYTNISPKRAWWKFWE